jgi:hypothetical protein
MDNDYLEYLYERMDVLISRDKRLINIIRANKTNHKKLFKATELSLQVDA